MTTPFDTTRLDEECERISNEIQRGKKWNPTALDVKTVLSNPHKRGRWDRDFAEVVFRLCRRPKMVPA
jgi:hypothetical protein